MNLADVRTQLAARLDTIDGLRCFAYRPPTIVPPAAWPAPESVTFDATYGRGSDEIALSVLVVVGKASERSAHDALEAYCDGTGDRSVKAVVESGTYSAFDAVRVAGAEFDVVTIAGTDYLAALFDIEIAGPGS
jgi:hypothetical protein